MKHLNKFVQLAFPVLMTLATTQSFGDTRVDNSEINKRDRAARAITADQHQMTGQDVEITRHIRQELMKEKDLSTYAQNIKIITFNGQVTLRGPVRSEKERRVILARARSASGVNKVINRLEIASKNSSD